MRDPESRVRSVGRSSSLAAAPVALFLGACAAPTPTSPPTAPPNEPAMNGSFVSLFSGEGLQGWQQVLDSPWKVEDGALVARQDPAGRLEGESWLLSQGDYEDFILQLRFRITPGGNSGVFFRDPLPRAARRGAANGGPPPWYAAYEVNINNDEPNYPTGSIWAIAKGRPGLQKEGEWNQLLIKVQGQKVWTWVNGQVALDGAELPARSTRGAIGFQRHGGAQYRDKVIELKEVEIREL